VTSAAEETAASSSPRRLPPVAETAIASLALAVVGGVVMASYVPRRPQLALPVALLAASAVLLVVAVVMMARMHEFAWHTFFLVARWALLAYVISAGIIELSFVHNHARGGPLAVVTGMLVVFAVDVPLIIAYTVARFTTPLDA
jgi:uncharacterized membrane protein YoaK (UPF0700 family)